LFIKNIVLRIIKLLLAFLNFGLVFGVLYADRFTDRDGDILVGVF